MSVIHSSKPQNQRTSAIENFESGSSRILIATDVIARGIDIQNISTVISFDTPAYPENYIHRIGRTGRAEQEGQSILLYNEKEESLKNDIENLMNYVIPFNFIPEEVKLSTQLTPEEKDKPIEQEELNHHRSQHQSGPAFHEKSAKNKKRPPQEKSYRRKMKEKYKKPIKRGDKIQNMKKRKKR
jgi:ATP-dependent RNA helicase RhlE